MTLPVSTPYTKLLIRDLHVDMVIGVYDFEKHDAQPVLVNLEADISGLDTVGANDQIDNVVSYEDIVNAIRALAAEGHIHLVETFAERIAASCLEDSRIHSVMVRVEKTAIFSFAGGVGVEIRRTRAV